MNAGPCVIRTIVFAKVPQPGRVKTRLIPALGRSAAAELAQRLLLQSLHFALEANLGAVELCATPGVPHPAWKHIRLPEGLEHSEQAPGDLGERLAQAARRTIENKEAVLLIGTDCPQLQAHVLQQAAEALKTHDATLIPATDGGYVLFGLNHFEPSVFADIPWSTAAVAEQTRARCKQLGWRLKVHPALHDIDTPEDLKKYPDLLPEYAAD